MRITCIHIYYSLVCVVSMNIYLFLCVCLRLMRCLQLVHTLPLISINYRATL